MNESPGLGLIAFRGVIEFGIPHGAYSFVVVVVVVGALLPLFGWCAVMMEGDRPHPTISYHIPSNHSLCSGWD